MTGNATSTQSASEGGDADSRREVLENRLEAARTEEEDLGERVRFAQQDRAKRSADLDEYLASCDGERRRRTHLVEASSTERERAEEHGLDLDTIFRQERKEAEARDRLADFEATVSERTGELRRRVGEADANVVDLSDQRSGRQRMIASLGDELNRLIATGDAERRALELQEEIERLAPLVEATRQSVGESAATDLSEDYSDQAAAHAVAWKRWGAGLLIAIAGSIAGGLLLFQQDSVPSGRLTNGAVVEVARNLVIVGLLIYLVRLAALQFRVHRHLEAVARNKATALSTFNRMVGVASEPEIRNSLATVLAQSVFASAETGFVGTDSDQITLIERVAGALPRPG